MLNAGHIRQGAIVVAGVVGAKLVEDYFGNVEIAWILLFLCVIIAILLDERVRAKTQRWSETILQRGARRPMYYFWGFFGVGAVLWGIVFGGMWLYWLYDYKRNPPSLPPSPPLSAISKQPIERTPTAAEIAEEVAKKLPSTPKPEPLLPAPIRLGTGPEAYKGISDEQVGQWAMEEADKIEELATRTMDSYKSMSDGALIWRFTNDFNDCCSQDIKDLRAEILRRLGPPAKDSDEISAWTMLFPETKYPSIKQFGLKQEISPMSAKHYAPYLRRLGLRLKRRAVPRSAPEPLQFSEEQIPADKPEFPYRIVVTIKAKRLLTARYIVVQFDPPGFAGAGCDFIDSKLVGGWDDFIENKALTDLLSKNVGTIYALEIGKTPFTPEKPVHVVAFGKVPFHVSKVTLFAE